MQIAQYCLGHQESLQQLLNEFDNVCKRRKLKMNIGKSKVTGCERLYLSLNQEILEEVDSLKYLRSIVSKKGGAVEDVIGRVNERAVVSGFMNRIWKGYEKIN